MLSQKLLVDVGFDMFTGKNLYQQRKSVTQSARITSFRTLAITSGQGSHLGTFSS
jgi:hypothetical protein